MSGRVLNNIASETIFTQNIQWHVDDWGNVKNFYAKTGDWLLLKKARQGTTAVIQIELMGKFGIAAKEIVTLRLFRKLDDSVKFETRRPWIIEGNGRIH